MLVKKQAKSKLCQHPYSTGALSNLTALRRKGNRDVHKIRERVFTLK